MIKLSLQGAQHRYTFDWDIDGRHIKGRLLISVAKEKKKFYHIKATVEYVSFHADWDHAFTKKFWKYILLHLELDAKTEVQKQIEFNLKKAKIIHAIDY